MFNHQQSSSHTHDSEGKNQDFLLKRRVNGEHSSWGLSGALSESDFVIIFLLFRFFSHILLGCSQGPAWLPSMPSSGSLHLTAKGERVLRSHCSALIWSRCSFETVSGITATSHVPIWIAIFLFFFFLPLSPLVKKIYRVCPSSLSKDRACGKKTAKRCRILSGFISLYLSCQL